MTIATHTSVAELPPKRERRKEARPQELIDAALTLFVDKVYAATKVDEVAALAGVSKGTLFLYFDTKEDLFKAVIRANLSEHFPVWNQEFDEFEGSTADMLAYAMQSWWERIGNTRASGITKLVTSEGSNFPEVVEFYEAEVLRPGRNLFKAILQRGIDRGACPRVRTAAPDLRGNALSVALIPDFAMTA